MEQHATVNHNTKIHNRLRKALVLAQT